MKDDPALLPLLLVEDGARELRDRGLDAVLRRAIARSHNFNSSHFLEQRTLLVSLSDDAIKVYRYLNTSGTGAEDTSSTALISSPI